MTDATSGTGVPAKIRAVSRFMKASVVVELLRAQHGEENARKIALQEAAEGEARDREDGSNFGVRLRN